MTEGLPPFDEKKVTMNQTLHLNGGRAFNKTQYAIKYDGVEIGHAVKGREGDKGVFTCWVNEQEYDMTTSEGQAAAKVAIKDKFVELFKTGQL